MPALNNKQQSKTDESGNSQLVKVENPEKASTKFTTRVE